MEGGTWACLLHQEATPHAPENHSIFLPRELMLFLKDFSPNPEIFKKIHGIQLNMV